MSGGTLTELSIVYEWKMFFHFHKNLYCISENGWKRERTKKVIKSASKRISTEAQLALLEVQ